MPARVRGKEGALAISMPDCRRPALDLLLAMGTPPNGYPDQTLPLAVAAFTLHLGHIVALLRAGADPNRTVPGSGHTPLDCALSACK